MTYTTIGPTLIVVGEFVVTYTPELTGELPEICMESPDIRDPRFDTYIFYDVFVEQLENYLGPHTNWDQSLLELLNRTYRTEATKILFI